LMPPIGWSWALFVWGYALVWFLINDQVKLLAYRILNPSKPAAISAPRSAQLPRARPPAEQKLASRRHRNRIVRAGRFAARLA